MLYLERETDVADMDIQQLERAIELSKELEPLLPVLRYALQAVEALRGAGLTAPPLAGAPVLAATSVAAPTTPVAPPIPTTPADPVGTPSPDGVEREVYAGSSMDWTAAILEHSGRARARDIVRICQRHGHKISSRMAAYSNWPEIGRSRSHTESTASLHRSSFRKLHRFQRRPRRATEE